MRGVPIGFQPGRDSAGGALGKGRPGAVCDEHAVKARPLCPVRSP